MSAYARIVRLQLLPPSAHFRIVRLQLLAGREHLLAFSFLILELLFQLSCLFGREAALVLRRLGGYACLFEGAF